MTISFKKLLLDQFEHTTVMSKLYSTPLSSLTLWPHSEDLKAWCPECSSDFDENGECICGGQS